MCLPPRGDRSSHFIMAGATPQRGKGVERRARRRRVEAASGRPEQVLVMAGERLERLRGSSGVVGADRGASCEACCRALIRACRQDRHDDAASPASNQNGPYCQYGACSICVVNRMCVKVHVSTQCQ